MSKETTDTSRCRRGLCASLFVAVALLPTVHSQWRDDVPRDAVRRAASRSKQSEAARRESSAGQIAVAEAPVAGAPVAEAPVAEAPVAIDPADLLESVRSLRFERRSHVATGRFLERFSEAALILDGVDLESLRLRRKGPRSVVLEAVYERPRVSDYRIPATQVARLRLIEEYDGWKLERIRVFPGSRQ